MTEENIDQGPTSAATARPAPIMQNVIELPAEAKLPLAPVPMTTIVTGIDPFKPKNLTEAMELANMMAKSTIVPKDYIDRPGNVFIAMQWGFELGLPVLQAMQNIAIINGRPTLWGDAVLAIVRAAVDVAGNRVLEGISETFDEATKTATCSVKRRGASKPCVRTFSLAEATKAGLIAKGGVWVAYTNRMLQMRARSWALRDEFTDVLRGMPIAEEVLDYVEREKDVSPAPTAAPAETKADRLKEKLKEPSSVVALAEALARINGSDTAEKLAEAADFSRGLSRPEDKAMASQAYKRVLAKLKGDAPEGETLESGGQAAASAA